MKSILGKTLAVLTGLLLVCLAAASVYADGWQWPSEMTVGGFAISQINGTVRADGSGTATASINIPGAGGKSINLTRSSSGDVTGSASSMSASMSGAEVQGSFTLDGGGLRGQGSVRCTPKTISGASITVSSDGRATGSGSVSFGSVNMSARFEVSGSSFGLNGSAPVRCHVDSPLAEYDFSGTLDLGGSNGRMQLTAKGLVQRKGKVAGVAEEVNVSGIDVDPNDGQGRLNVGGVTVTFSFFGS